MAGWGRGDSWGNGDTGPEYVGVNVRDYCHKCDNVTDRGWSWESHGAVYPQSQALANLCNFLGSTTGHGMVSRCDHTRDTLCHPCETGFYNEAVNYDTCKQCTQCNHRESFLLLTLTVQCAGTSHNSGCLYFLYDCKINLKPQ